MDIAHVDMQKDFDFRLDFDIEEDIEGELGDFVRLVRLNLIKQARCHFQQVLLPHSKLFPVFAEFAELLVSEKAYHELLENLPGPRYFCGYSDEEWYVVVMLEALARVYTEQDFDGAIEAARNWRTANDLIPAQERNEIQIHCLEIYLDIMTVLESRGVQLEGSDYQPSASQARRQKWQAFRDLIPTLLEKRKDWEAHKFCLLLLNVSTKDEADHLFSNYISRLRHRDQQDETEIIARLNVTSAYLNHIWLHGSRQPLARLVQLNSTVYQDLAVLSLNSYKAKFRYVEMLLKIYIGYLYQALLRPTSSFETLTLTTVILVLVAATGFWTVWGFPYTNELRKAVAQQHKPGALISTLPLAPMKQTPTGNKFLEKQLAVLLRYPFSAVEGTRANISLFSLYSWGQNLALWIIIHIESLRAGNQGKFLLTSITMLGLVAVFVGYGYVIPLWFAFHLWTSPTVSDPNGSNLVPNGPFGIALIPFGVITGLGIPSLLMCLPTPALLSFETKQKWTALYQGWPIWVYLADLALTIIAICIVPWSSYIKTEQERTVLSWKYLRQTYFITIALSAGTHLTLLALLVPQVRAIFTVANASTELSHSLPPSTIPEITSWRLSWNIAVASIAVLAWGVALRLSASDQKLSLYTATMRIISTIGIAVLLGPGAAAANDISARDGYILLSGEPGAGILKGHGRRVTNRPASSLKR